MRVEARSTLTPLRHLRFIVFTNRNPDFDFRRPFVEALRCRYETYYIWLKARPLIYPPSKGDSARQVSLMQLISFFRRFPRSKEMNVYFNSTENFPILTAILRLVSPVGIWCIDFHDDPFYSLKGLKKWKVAIANAILRFSSDLAVHASPELKELFPHSKHLGNASHLMPLRRETAATNKVLVISSFDPRIDFDFLAEVAAACPACEFHLYGWTEPADKVSRQKLHFICNQRSNIRYHGAYALDDLPAILREFRVCLAPYRTGIRLTRYIDPLRFYSCLNTGMEVVSTDIPQARRMRTWIHVVREPSQCANTIITILAGKLTKLEGYVPITWEDRVDRLVEIVTEAPRTAKLRAKLGELRSAT